MRKKKLKESDILNNSKDNPLNIIEYSEKSIWDYHFKHLNKIIYTEGFCIKCSKHYTRQIRNLEYKTLPKLYMCRYCNTIESNLKNFGVINTFQRTDVINKIHDIVNVKYGGYTMQSPILVEKVKKTNLERYGVEWTTQSDEMKNKSKETCLEKYGVEYYCETDEFLDKVKKTNNENLGTDYPMQSEEIKEKSKATCLEKYGVEWVSQSEEIKNKVRTTNLEKYSKLHFNHKYLYNNEYFDSSWELAFYIYHMDKSHNIIHEATNFMYMINKNTHYYTPDFKINNRYYEIKGEQYIVRYKNGKIKTLRNPYKNTYDNEKYKCMKKHNVIIIDKFKIVKYLNYVNKTYGINY